MCFYLIVQKLIEHPKYKPIRGNQREKIYLVEYFLIFIFSREA